MDEMIAFVVASIALTGSPGPATLSIAAAGAAYGPRGGLAYMAGVITGLIVVIAVVAAGVEGIVAAIPGAAAVLTGLAGAYILYLAWRIATAPPLGAEGSRGPRSSYAGGIFLSLVNPKGYAAMAALFSGFVLIDGDSRLDIALKVAVVLAVILAVDLAWLSVGAAITRLFHDPKANRAINVTFAVLLVVSVAAALVPRAWFGF
jgi:threonine/homoserine/homoserine lactone efflux protein